MLNWFFSLHYTGTWLAVTSIDKLLPPKWHIVPVKGGVKISIGRDNLIEAGLSDYHNASSVLPGKEVL